MNNAHTITGALAVLVMEYDCSSAAAPGGQGEGYSCFAVHDFSYSLSTRQKISQGIVTTLLHGFFSFHIQTFDFGETMEVFYPVRS
jgi:hypothetical protein